MALVWTGFAAICDLRTREVPNWLSFSFIAFALAYKVFYSIAFAEWRFFVFGAIGFSVFYLIALAFYYGKVFAGGDAKLLMGIGAMLPVFNFYEFILYGAVFILLLFLVGAGYSIVYTIYLVLISLYEHFL